MLELLALLAFIAGGVWAAVERGWPLMLLAAGLALWVATGLDIQTG